VLSGLAAASVPACSLAQGAPASPGGRISLDGGGLKFGGPIIMAGTTNVLPLLKRSDVQSHIGLSLRQKNELNEILTGPQRITVNLVDHGDKDDAARQRELEKQVAAQVGGPEEKVKAVLKPEQYSRLQELQLQWKGVLILADQKIADKVGISRETRPEINKIVGEYNMEKMKVMQSLMQVDETPRQDGNNVQLRRMVKMNTKELENPLSPAYKALDEAKKAAEKKVLAALTPEDRDSWRKAQGAPFTFRTDIAGNRF
jgi:hypothetical protein